MTKMFKNVWLNFHTDKPKIKALRIFRNIEYRVDNLSFMR